MKYSVEIPNGWKMNLAMIKDPVEAYEAMTNVAKAADEDGYESIWMVDHFLPFPHHRRRSPLRPGCRWRP